MRITGLLALAVAPALADAWSAVYYKGPRCKGKPLAHQNMTEAGTTCHRSVVPPGVKAQSVMIKSFDRRQHDHDDDDRTSSVLRFYDTDDCSSSCSNRHVIATEHYFYWEDCISWPLASKDGREMLSFNIEKTGDIGLGRYSEIVASDGVCRLEHGDDIFARGRQWKMQQTAATWFKEIPLEEWDPTVHVQNTTVRFAQHGDVDAWGLYKMHENWGYFDNIEFEFWDDEKHIRIKDRTDRPGFYDDLVEDLCEDATLENLDREILLQKIPNVDEICKGWVNGVNVAEDFPLTQTPM